MPFTFCHPAIVLPLTKLPKTWFSLTGLIVGSLTPDFEYFIKMRVESHFSHTISGLFWFDVPFGILLAFVYHDVVRYTFVENLPGIFNSRLSVFNGFNWNTYFKTNWIVVLISILIGAASHHFWDGFTHEQGYFTRLIPFLTSSVKVSGIRIPVFKIFQHASTVLGALVILFTLMKLPINPNANGKFHLRYWITVTIIALTIVTIKLLTGLDYTLYGDVIVTCIAAILISLVMTPLLLKSYSVNGNIVKK